MYVYVYVYIYIYVYIPVGFDWVFWWVELMSRACGFESGFITGKDRICWPLFDRKSRATLEIKLENHVITSISMRVHTIYIYIYTQYDWKIFDVRIPRYLYHKVEMLHAISEQ